MCSRSWILGDNRIPKTITPNQQINDEETINMLLDVDGSGAKERI